MVATKSIDKLIRKEENRYKKTYLKLNTLINQLNGKDPVKLQRTDRATYKKYYRMKKTLIR